MPLGGRPYIPLQEQSKYAILEHYKNKNDIDIMKEMQLTKFHACDRPRKYSEPNLTYNHSFEYLEPPEDYVCSGCSKLGHHYKEACFIWPKKYGDGSLLFGSKKFGSAIETNELDAKKFSILHRRNK